MRALLWSLIRPRLSGRSLRCRDGQASRPWIGRAQRASSPWRGPLPRTEAAGARRAQRLCLQASALSMPSAGGPSSLGFNPKPTPWASASPARTLSQERPRRRSWNLIPSSQPKKPNLLPILLPTGCQEPAASPYRHALSPLSPTSISHLFHPSPHRNVCRVTQPPLGQAGVGRRLESLSPSPPNPPRSPGSVWFSQLGGRPPSLPCARLPRPSSLLRPGFS